jgi:hypothetical protein
MIGGLGNAMVLGGVLGRYGGSNSVSNNTTIIMDADTEIGAIPFIPETDQHITHVDMLLNFIGDHTAIHYTLGIYADSADAPDTATLMGGLTAEVHGISGGAGTGAWLGGGTDPIELTTHADLVANTPYWLCLQIGVSGGGLNAGVTVGMRGLTISPYPLRSKLYTGTWGTASTIRVGYVVKVGSLYYGLPFDTSVATSSRPDIFVDTGNSRKQGISFKVGCKMYLRGILVTLTKTGTPENLDVYVYTGTTELWHEHINDLNIITAVPRFIWFTTPVPLAPDVMTYIILSQTGTSTSHDYNLRVNAVPANYMSAAQDDNFRMVYGTETVPTTVSPTECPNMWPVVCDTAVDLDQEAAGAGAGSSSGIMRGMSSSHL